MIELRQQMFGALDGSRHELWKKTNKSGKAEKVPLPVNVPEVEINGVTEGLESEKGDADRKQVLETKRHERGRVREPGQEVERREKFV